MLHHVTPPVTVHVTLKVILFIISDPYNLQHVTPTFNKNLVPFKNIGVTNLVPRAFV